MPTGVAQVKITGNVTEALAALDALGIKAEETGAKTEAAFGDKLAGSAEKTGGIFQKLGSVVGGLGLPFGESFSKLGEKVSEAEVEGKKFSGTMTELGKVMTVGVAAGVGVAAAESLKLAGNYQQVTASIASHAGISEEAAKKIGDAFLSTVGSTTFSAQEIATAFAPVSGEFVNIYGHALSAGDSLTVMKAAMDAAEASGTPLKDTTKALADTMQVFHLKVGDASKAGDDLFNTSRLMGVSVSDLGSQMSRIEPRIVGSGMNLQQLSGFMLELTHSTGSGRQAMRIVGQAMQQLESPSAAAQKAMAKMGISFTDAQGHFVGTGTALDELKSVMNNGSIPATQKQALMTALFSRQANIMIPLIQGGSAALEKNAAMAGKVGTAQAGAEKQASTLHGTLEKLKATGEDLGVKFGDMLIPILNRLGQVVAGVVNWFEKHKAVAEAVGIAIAALVAGPIAMYIGSMVAAAAASIAAAAPIYLIIGAAVALGAGIYELATHWSTVWAGIEAVAEAVWHALDTAWHAVDSTARSVWGGIESFFKSLWANVTGVFTTALQTVQSLLLAAWNLVTSGVTTLVGDVEGFFAGLWSTITGGVSAGVSDVVGFFEGLPGQVMNAVGGLLGDMLSFGENIVHAIVQGIGNVGGDILGAIEHLIPGGGILGKAAHFLGFSEGGIVPGAVGAPMLAVVHGGETIIPPAVLHGGYTPGPPLPASMAGAGGGGQAPNQQFNIVQYNVPTDPHANATDLAYQIRTLVK